ncbi:PP2C family protein-serine/threonine phosphatase [Streptomyces sp. SL13]|uniref:PP2C family protein-serine/threonine phosphatase n=1 Tax=Streptantibioticus silvisoli TaxID=2705255 RepID=A0AA90HCB6_9ACTN|nr:PP2C family protein-serine/threonine phosphatase [Streptantibioticus silvisoli]MDI5964758.1 PP2C family protein-serine/threonine phosphatase [Streptantibioticus silvisoli]MDI5973100.1 PP2C family protein-serine/threonine phosphatase [Streptantibioticus silvisoli]
MRQGRAGTEAVTTRWRRALHRARTVLRRTAVDYFRGDASDWLPFTALLACVPLLGWATVGVPVWCPPTALVFPVLLGGLLLRPASLLLLYVAAAGALVVEDAVLGPYQDAAAREVTPGTVLVVSAVAFAGLMIAQFRSRVGVPWRRGGTMLFDLRERLRVQSRLPQLPAGWHAEMALRPAGGQSFSGDFVVATRSADGRYLEAVLTDVSGKGMDAGSRALLLSGAFGGLLGSLPPGQFLPAANGYLLRQKWEEGFATSVHLVLDLDSGDYELLSAGHLPGMQLSAGTGCWQEKAAEGLMLGVDEDAEFGGVKGTLRSGDALMLYTDGLVEAAGRDITEGIDRLVGAADHYAGTGFQGAAWLLIEAVAKDVNDDRALLIISRD